MHGGPHGRPPGWLRHAARPLHGAWPKVRRLHVSRRPRWWRPVGMLRPVHGMAWEGRPQVAQCLMMLKQLHGRAHGAITPCKIHER